MITMYWRRTNAGKRRMSQELHLNVKGAAWLTQHSLLNDEKLASNKQ